MSFKVNLDELMKQKAAAEDRKITLQEVATETKISYLTLQKLRKPDGGGCQLSTVEKLCRYFGKSINEVVVDVAAA